MDKIKIGMDALQNDDMKSFVFALIQLVDADTSGEPPFEITLAVREYLKDYVPDYLMVGDTVARLIQGGIIDIDDGMCYYVDRKTGKIVFVTLEQMEALVAQDKEEGYGPPEVRTFRVPNIVGHA